MTSRPTSRRSKWLLAAMFSLVLVTGGSTVNAASNYCVYHFKFFGWTFKVVTTEPLPGGDIAACRI